MDHAAPSVSVVLPTYNRATSLPRAVESVLRQTFSDLELIIVDDGSTDNTRQYLDTIADPRVRVVFHEKNKGGNVARNTGIDASHGELLAFQDSDDEWLITKLEKQVGAYRELGDEFKVVYCGKVVYGRDEGSRYGSRLVAYMPDRSRTIYTGDLYKALISNAIAGTITMLIERKLLLQVGKFDETLRVGQDWELTIRLARETRFYCIEEPLLMAFIMPDSISHRRFENAHTVRTIIRKHGDFFSTDRRLLADKLFQMSRSYQRTGYWGLARPVLWAAVRQYPKNWKAWVALGLSCINRKNMRENAEESRANEEMILAIAQVSTRAGPA
jgi:glycosyltransferase involved in cell wall biosynthesis